MKDSFANEVKIFWDDLNRYDSGPYKDVRESLINEIVYLSNSKTGRDATRKISFFMKKSQNQTLLFFIPEVMSLEIQKEFQK